MSRELQSATNNQLDSWFNPTGKVGTTNSKGAKRDQSRTWHSDLYDKPQAIRFHVSTARNIVVVMPKSSGVHV